MATRRVGVREAKAQLSALLRDVSNGVDIVITDHNRPVARLVAIEVNGDEDVAAQLERAERLGLIGPAPKGGPLPPPIVVEGQEPGWALRELLADRDAGP